MSKYFLTYLIALTFMNYVFAATGPTETGPSIASAGNGAETVTSISKRQERKRLKKMWRR